MKFIHTADLHIDSKMESNLSSAKAKERKAELLHTFGRLAAYAAANNVTAVIIAGDMFDSPRATQRARNHIIDVIRSTPNVDFLYLAGNHDEGVFEGELPPNLKSFGEDWTYFEYGDVTIAGARLGSDTGIYDRLKLSDSRVNIVAMHGQESNYSGGRDGAETVNLSALRSRYIDYLALGHVHSFKAGELDKRGVWCYSGCLEGRGFDECGDKGFVVLETAKGKPVKAEFVPFAGRKLFEVEVDITGLTAVSQIEAKADDALAKVDKGSLIKLCLAGTYTEDTQKDIKRYVEELNNRFYFAKAGDDRSRLAINIADYKDDVSLKGEFIRLVLAADGLGQTQTDTVICYGINALRGEDID